MLEDNTLVEKQPDERHHTFWMMRGTETLSGAAISREGLRLLTCVMAVLQYDTG